MMRKMMAVAVVAVTAVALAGMSFAYGGGRGPGMHSGFGYDSESWEEWHDERMEDHKGYVEDLLEDNKITEEEAQAWIEHLDFMDEFHDESGYMWMGDDFRGFGRFSDAETWEEFQAEKTEAQKDAVEKLLDEGKITPSEAEAWKDHIDFMTEFREENGYGYGFLGGGCHGGARRGGGFGRGFGQND